MIKIVGKVSDIGQFSNAARLYSVWKELKGKSVQVIIKEHKPRRTNKQNAYLFGAVYPEISGRFPLLSNEAVHKRMKRKFLSYRDEETDTFDTRSTADLDIEEIAVYIENIAEWAASRHSIIIPEAVRSHERIAKAMEE